jgi:hypothetical protein
MDKRILRRTESLSSALCEKQEVSLRCLSNGHTEEMGYYRLLSNSRLRESDLAGLVYARLKPMIKGRHVLALGDTTDMDYSNHKGRVKPNSGLGYIGDHKGLGYNAHVSLVLDGDSGSVYGLSDLQLWHRETAKSAFSQLREAERRRCVLKKKSKIGEGLSAEEKAELANLGEFSVEVAGKKYNSQYRFPLEHRESYRWALGSENSNAVLAEAAKVTHIHDREGDIYDTFAKIIPSGRDLLIRSRTSRSIETQVGEAKYLHAYREELPELGRYTIEIKDRETGTERWATLSLKTAEVKVKRGDPNAFYQVDYPPKLSLTVVYAEEVAESTPEGKTPIFWCLLTTHKVQTLADAEQITYWYSLRWWIELLFKLVKKDGFNLESSELETGYALRKLGVLTMQAAIHVLQLKQARDGDQTLPIEAVFSDNEIAALEAIAPKWNGNTAKQTNPHIHKTLPWASWIIARIGGWKGYKNNRPPGILTLKKGLNHFRLIAQGFSFSN